MKELALKEINNYVNCRETFELSERIERGFETSLREEVTGKQ